MPRKILCLHLLAIISFFFSGCATIMHGSRQGVFLTCEPRVAAIYIDGKYIGQTPTRVILKRGKNHHLKLELPGYKPFEAELTRKLDGWAFGNIFGLVGIALDAYNGSMYRLSPKDMYPELTPLPAEGATGSNNLHILITLHPDPPLEKVAYTMPESVFVEFFFL
jgi:hypothetical protein